MVIFPSIAFIVFFILPIIPIATPLIFNLPNIGPNNQNRDIVTTGNGAYISDGGIQVTPDGIGSDRSQKAGRATYISPLHLWDNVSGELSDFSTNFTFIIDSNGATPYGDDGLAFFLTENNTHITPGGAMGLPIDATTIVASHQFVSVEFDTFWNDWDPRDESNMTMGDHVGINVSNLTSSRYEKWWSNITGGRENNVWIDYKSATKNLSVVFTGYQNNTKVRQFGLHYVVDLREVLPEWVIFGFGASTGFYFQKNNVKSWSFSSSDLQVDASAEPPSKGPEKDANANANAKPPSVVITQGTKKDGNKSGLVVGLSVGGVCAFVGALGVFLFAFWRKRKRENNDEDGFNEEMDNEFEMGLGPKKFSYYELAHSTNNFSEEQKLGEGGFGGVYKGFLKELSSYVAVKRVSKSSKQGIKEYASEVRIISRLRHRNMVQLIGWCHEKRELLLIYEYMENGSLDSHLFKQKSLLSWGIRYKIAQGLASALLYLHEEWEQCVLHRDIKSSNIMLDSNFNAKLGDFGLAKLVDHEKGSQTTVMAGTMGYMAPECCVTGKATKETDVFSFGVVALEIACGRKPIVFNVTEPNQMRLVEWVWELYGTGKLLEAADPRLGVDFDEEEMEHLMIVGLWCAHPDENIRPSVKKAIQVLNFEAPLPILPPNMPVPTYSSSPPLSIPLAYGENVSANRQTQHSSACYGSTDSSMLTASAASSPSASLLYTK